MSLQLPAAKIIVKLGVDVAKMRNEVLKEMEGDWCWFIDDDHTFSGDLLQKLLARDVDVVQPVVLKRYSPFGPVHMGPKLPDNEAHWQFALTQGDPIGLKEVHIVGAAGCLIRKHVIDKVGFPWFEIGRLEPDGLGEDIIFCRKAKALGFRIWCDLENPLGHLNVGAVTPKRKPDGNWYIELEFGNQKFEVPVPEPKFMTDAQGNVTEVMK
jgi:hypothetical protein